MMASAKSENYYFSGEKASASNSGVMCRISGCDFLDKTLISAITQMLDC
jgi:hypothetical protein